ncbi:MAG: peptide deformylase [Myxococcales bacterium]
MSMRRIVYYPHEVLATRAPDVTNVDGDLVRLLDDMAETMYHARGIGLAAPQVGVSARVITVDVSGPEDRGRGLLQLVNPRIVESHGEGAMEEGCLSFPGIAAEIKRPSEILVQAWDRDGRELQITAGGLLAVCLQHEIDHLDGVTFVDHLTGLRKKLVMREYARARRQLEIEETVRVPR